VKLLCWHFLYGTGIYNLNIVWLCMDYRYTIVIKMFWIYCLLAYAFLLWCILPVDVLKSLTACSVNHMLVHTS
jgi:hypothetical protein